MELPWLLLLAAVPLFIVLLSGNKKNRANLPPGPVAVPVLGHLLWVRYKGMDVLRAIRRLHARHGPVLALRVGSLLQVTVSDRRLAHAALVERGAALADRPASASRHMLGLDAATIARRGPRRWRSSRRSSGKKAASRRRSSSRCSGSWWPCASATRASTSQRDLLLFSATKLRVFAFLPAVTTRLFGGRMRTILAMRRRLKDMYTPLIDARRDRKTKLGDDEGGRALTDDEMIAMCSEFLNGGTDTTSTALQWIMAELVKNPAVQDKLHDEIKHTLASTGSVNPYVSEEDVQRMPYLKAVALEGLRRQAEDMELGGYTIPTGATVNFMVADMGMDERAWERPAEFAPERFMPGGDGEGTDITGTREIMMMPFGAGRRICPGLNVATLHLEYFVANLVQAFQWHAPGGEEVDVASKKAEFTVVMANPLCARLVPRGDVA